MSMGTGSRHGGLLGAVVVWVAMALPMAAMAAERQLDFAAEDAAYQSIREMTNADLAVERLAFLGLFGDTRALAPAYRAGLVRTPGQYQFFTRDDAEWNRLVSEIEFGDPAVKGDVMNQQTIQKFGKVKGVEALLYGDIREAAVDPDGSGIVRLAMTVAQVETGQILWTANIVGRYMPVAEAPAVPRPLVQAALKATEAAAAKITAANLGGIDVYVLPLSGQFASGLDDIVSGNLAGKAASGIRFFVPPSAPADRRTVQRIAAELGGGGSADLRQLGRITKQLEQLFDMNDAGAGVSQPEPRKMAVLTGRIVQADVDAAANKAGVMMNLSMRDINSGQILWGQTVEGMVEDDWQDRMESDAKGLLTVRNVGIAVAALVGLLLVMGLFRMTQRPR